MKTQYQNDYNDKYVLYKNINNSNTDKNTINKTMSNNKEYYNPINDYENIESNIKNITIEQSNKNAKTTNNYSPKKKRILIRRYQNSFNEKNNNENIFENKDKDLQKKRKCKIEFDLEKDDTEFDKCEIFGNPVCYNCLKSKKGEKNFQIFYCSQCMKLFCRDCLYQHNYMLVSDN